MDKFIANLKLAWSKTNRWHRVLFIFLVVELRLVPGGHLGFRCNDPALSYPYTGDTISWKWLMGIATLLPLVIMMLVERSHDTEDKQRSNRRALRWFKEYMYGFILSLTLVQSLKLVVGSPRPHFFDTCKPMEASTCEGSEFVSSYTCTVASWLYQSDKSFPSGHTSMALQAGIFIAYYLHRRASDPQHHIIRGIQWASVAAAVVCSVSRMTDHRHHWWDVVAGAAIAAAILVYSILTLCRNFECSETTHKNIERTTKEEQANEESNGIHFLGMEGIKSKTETIPVHNST